MGDPGLSGGSPDPLLARHDDPSLERLLPKAVAATPLSTRSLSAAEFIPEAASSAFAAFVGPLGGDVAGAALATAFDGTGSLQGTINALRVPGADPGGLLAAYVSLEAGQAPESPTVAERDIAGRVVHALTIGTGPNSVTRYVFGDGDVVFIVDAIDEQTAIAFIEAVP
jgi:hypothetical protein